MLTHTPRSQHARAYTQESDLVLSLRCNLLLHCNLCVWLSGKSSMTIARICDLRVVLWSAIVELPDFLFFNEILDASSGWTSKYCGT